LAKIADNLLGKDRTKVAVFGDALFGGTMKGVGPAPVTKIRDYLARHGRVVLIPEFRTSKACNLCGRDLRNSNKRILDRSGKYRSDFTSLHCTNSLHGTWNRDWNAAQNIAWIFVSKMQGDERPPFFLPPKK